MGTALGVRSICECLVIVSLCLAGSFAAAEDATTVRKVISPPTTPRLALVNSGLLRLDSLPKSWEEHPLTPALIYAAEHQQQMLKEINDFTCVLAKRERINGRLRDYEYLATKVRRERIVNGRVVTPYSVFLEFLAPKKVQGRRVLYVEGWNEGKMMVRNGGQRFSFVTVNLDPLGEAALRENRYPITELGLTNVVGRLIEQAHEDIHADPTGENTKVHFYRDAKIDGRACTHIRVVHPKPAGNLEFHIANIYVDDQLKVPLRVEAYLWPESEGEEPPLIEEYTYMKLKLNVGLTDADFTDAAVTQ